jgi:hypothetical protein
VFPQEPRAGTPKQSSEHERDQDGVVELAGDRDEVRHEVKGEREVDESQCRRDLPTRRHARIGQQPLEQDRAVRHEPRDHADVPLVRADHERGDERRVDGD